jgi:hypothetical protein
MQLKSKLGRTAVQAFDLASVSADPTWYIFGGMHAGAERKNPRARLK